MKTTIIIIVFLFILPELLDLFNYRHHRLLIGVLSDIIIVLLLVINIIRYSRE